MVRREVVEQFECFENLVFSVCSVKDFLKLNNDIELFINSTKASQEEMADFINSGAGEMLEMVISGIEYAKLG